jgi:flagellar biosynthesis/type III secretory pathway chaperone
MTHSATIKLPNESYAYDLMIYNMMGKLVKRMDNISGPMETLNRDNLTNGVYLYQLIQSNLNEYDRAISKEQTFSGKLIIK